MAVPWSYRLCRRAGAVPPRRGRAVRHSGTLRSGWNAAVTAHGDTQEADRDQSNVYFHERVSTNNWIFTPLLPFERTSRHPQLCQGWIPELSMAVPLGTETSVQSCCLGASRERHPLLLQPCHLPVQGQGCDTHQHHVLPLHLLNHSSCCLPCSHAHPPHLFLRTSLQHLCTAAP